MISMMGICDGGFIKFNRKMDDRCVGVFIAIRLIIFLLNVLKWSRLEIEEGFLVESNYVLIVLVIDIELIFVEVTDVRIVNGDIIRRFVIK